MAPAMSATAATGAAAVIRDEDWRAVHRQLDAEGHAPLPTRLDAAQMQCCARMAREGTGLHRVAPVPDGLGRGDLLRFDGDLPAPLSAWQAMLYRQLVPIANAWNERLGIDRRYPPEFEHFIEHNRRAGQTRTQSQLIRLREHDHLALHQRNDGEHVFPLQVVVLLSTPGRDFTGGEFVMTEQRPRMQSRPVVVPMNRGDAAVIATGQRPVDGANGPYRVNLKHAIGHVRGGERLGLELTFHNAS